MFEFRKQVDVPAESGVEEQLPRHRAFFLVLRIAVSVLAFILLIAAFVIMTGGRFGIVFPLALMSFSVLSVPAIFLLTKSHVSPVLVEVEASPATVAVYAYRFDDEKLITNYLLGEKLIDISKIKYEHIRSIIEDEVGYHVLTGEGKTYIIEHDSLVYGNADEIDDFLSEKLADRFHPMT